MPYPFEEDEHNDYEGYGEYRKKESPITNGEAEYFRNIELQRINEPDYFKSIFG